jgi:ATP-dependent Clp protease protease subunit
MHDDEWPSIPDLPGIPSTGAPADAGPAPWGRESLTDALSRRLFEQRVVLLHGPLDDLSVTRASAELMTLDADGDDPVTLRVDSGEGSLALALTLMDVVELMGVPVRALCLGQVGEGAVGVVAVCARRAALPNTRFALREPASGAPSPVHVRNVAQWAALRADERDRFCARVAGAAGRPVDEVREDLVRGRYLDAGEAVSYGLIDEVCRPGADIKKLPGPSGQPGPGQPGQPMGFRPLR